jgi:hypothetical protein
MLIQAGLIEFLKECLGEYRSKMKQNLIIQVDTAHDDIKGCQTPAVVSMLRRLADHFEKCGVQMTTYPIQEACIRVDLLESGNDENWEPSLFVPQDILDFLRLATKMRATAIVDDDFPETLHKFDTELKNLRQVLGVSETQ